MAYSITDLSHTVCDYQSDDGNHYAVSMRTAYLTKLGASSLAAATTALNGFKGKPRHVYIAAHNGTKLLRRKIPFNGTPPAAGTQITVDGLTWVTEGYTGEKKRGFANVP